MDYLCVGHVCMDMTESGFVLGGSASYCSLYAKALGYRSGVITSYGEEYEFVDLLNSLDNKQVLEAKRSTIFENIYEGQHRKQILHSIAENIYLDEFISKKDVSILHLCPLADELVIGPNFSSDSFVCMTIQGWLRDRNKKREVIYKEMDFEVLKHADVVVLSKEDIPDLEIKLELLKSLSKILIVTNGSVGASCYFEGKEIFSAAYPAKMIDPTGAGDIFATGFCLKYQETKDVESSMIAAHCLASLCVEREGVENIPNTMEWSKRVREYSSI